MTDLADRYGTSRRGVRSAVVISAALGVAFLAWLAWSAWSFSTPEVRSELVGFDVVSEHEATAKVDIRISDPDVVGTCTVRAFAADHTVVGELSFGVPGPDDIDRNGGLMEVSVRTERRATSVGELGCTTAEQVHPR
ncbi:DUF4307 domain-containing protein [Nocardioides sp.]|uniref:DUF4307 domain-containing protein n=1 Tax=Nocardioides sp. TaxID=35761 RepID=UPI003D0F79EC